MAEDQEERLKELEQIIEVLTGDLTRLSESYEEQLQLSAVPIGTILPFYGDLNLLPENWKVCNGDVVTDNKSPFLDKPLPDLRQKFLRGVQEGEPNAELGDVGGEDFIADHNHDFSGSTDNVIFPKKSVWDYSYNNLTDFVTDSDQNIREYKIGELKLFNYKKSRALTIPYPISPYPEADESHGHKNGHASISGTTSSSGKHDNRPKYYSVYFIIRIR